MQANQGLPHRLLRTQRPAVLEGLRSAGGVALQEQHLTLHAEQLWMWRTARKRLLQRRPCPARITPEQQAARPGDVGEHVVGEQLKVAFVATCSGIGEAE